MSVLLMSGALQAVALVALLGPGLLLATIRTSSPLSVALSPIVVVGLVMPAAHLWLRFGLDLRIFALGVGLVLCAVFAAAAARIALGKLATNMPMRDIRTTACVLGTALLVGLWAVLPPLWGLHQRGVGMGFATIGNNDVVNYGLTVRALMETGLDSSSRITNVDYGLIAQSDSFGAFIFIGALASAFGLAAWQVLMASMALAVSLAVMGLYSFSSTLWPHLRFAPIVATVPAMLSALGAYLIAQYFLAGVLGLTALASMLAGAVQAGRGTHPKTAVVAIVGGTTLGMYCYPQLALPAAAALPIVTGVVSLILGRANWHRTLTSLALVVVGLVLSALVSFQFLTTAYELIAYRANVVAGWPLPFPPSFVALAWPGAIGQSFGLRLVWVSWMAGILVAIVLLVSAAKRWRPRDVLCTALILAGATIVTALGVVLFGSDAYQTWKLLGHTLPLALTMLLPALSFFVVRNIAVGGLALAAIFGSVSMSMPQTWGPTLQQSESQGWTTPGMVELADPSEISAIRRLNVRLDPYFETMAVSLMVGSERVAMNSQTYAPPQVLSGACTLTRQELITAGEHILRELSGGYAIVSEAPSVKEFAHC